MNTRDQFGNYLLLKKLSEDALGEVFRAGRIGRQSLERVVLLRVYNGQGLDTERVARTIQARGGLSQALKSPNLATAIDSGQVRGVPYVAYDYVSGRSLPQLTEQATRRGQPVPLDHALLIAERMASGLAVAYETRFADDRVMHGFLTPHQILVSHEGELKLSGFEASPGLRASAGHPVVKQALGRYLAPEALAGQPAAKNDDVYSLASILYEMLTGQPTPPMPPGGIGAQVDQAVVAADGGNLHPDLAALLKRSLCPREQRVGDVASWHKTLAKLMADGQYNPTTFNLAFFLHNLFRDEIERETQELESERTQAIQLPVPAPSSPPAAASGAPQSAPAVSAPPPPAPTFGGATREVGGAVKEDTGVLRDRYGLGDRKGEGGKKTQMLIAAAVGGVAVLGLGAWLLFGRGGGDAAAADDATPVDPAAATAPAATTPAAPAAPTPEEIQAQIAAMVAEQSKQLEAGLKAQYADQLKGLQKQLEDAKRADAAPRPAAPSTTSAAAPATSRPATEPAPTQTSAATPASGTTGAPAVTPPGSAGAPASAAPGTSTAPVPPGATATSPTAPAAADPAAAAAAGVPVEPAPAPTVRPGDLVTMGPGVVPPRLLRRPQLNYPPIAQRMKKEATVTVSVLIDENGRVVDVRTVGAKAGFGMDEAASDHARACSWAPASKQGVKVKMWSDLKVAFTLSGRT